MSESEDLCRLVDRVCQAVYLPVAVELGASYTAPEHLARRLAAAGPRGLVLSNRFSQPEA